MFQKVIGIITFCLGGMAGESDSIVAPLVLFAIGIGLYLIGERLEARR